MASRTKNTSRNIVSGMLNKMVAILLPFVNRTVILYVLGAEYTGLSGLFTSILEVLNIANLGFNTSIVYCMYKPMAEGDKEKLKYYLTIYKKIYHIVGTVIFCGGILLMPFLQQLINGSYPQSINLYILYFLYLINSTVGYFLFAYKESLLLADQRQDISNNIRTLVDIVRYIAQFISIVITKDFYIYVFLQICGTAVSNVLIQRSTISRYPDLCCLKKERLQLPSELKYQTGALMIARICDTFRNSFDSIIISMNLGLIAITIYGNYYYVYSAVYSIMLVVSSAMGASIGNSIASESVEKNFQDIRHFQFIYSFICSICTACLIGLYQPFMNLWVGESLMLSDGNMILFCVYFYLINMCNIRNQYINGTGMWWELKISFILEALGNLLLNIVLGKVIGITGILLATIVTIFVFNYLTRTHKLFIQYFKSGEKLFNLDQIQYLLVTAVSSTIVFVACSAMKFDGIVQILLNGTVAVFVSAVCFLLAFCRTERFAYALELIAKLQRIFIGKSKKNKPKNLISFKEHR